MSSPPPRLFDRERCFAGTDAAPNEQLPVFGELIEKVELMLGVPLQNEIGLIKEVTPCPRRKRGSVNIRKQLTT